MFPTTLTQPQREGIFDLLLLGMYADDKLRLAENQELYHQLSPYGWESYLDPQKYSELATARARAAHETEDGTNAFLINISARLEHDDVRKLALALLARLIEADHEATESEADYYQQARTAFGI